MMLKFGARVAAVLCLTSMAYAASNPPSKVIRQSIQCPSFKGIYQLKNRPVVDGWTLWLTTAQPVEISTASDPDYTAQVPNANAFIHALPANKHCEYGRILLSCIGSTNEGYSYILNRVIENAHYCRLNAQGDGYICVCTPGVGVPTRTKGLSRTKPQPIVFPKH